ncbi:MAG: MBL fold metallo-hydrolase [Christensenellales bacterium]|jgi:hydroxyacylglutathione hydrolase
MAAQKDRPFTARKVAKNTWLITGVGCDFYLLTGNKKAALIDTGMSRNNLAEFVAGLTDFPVMVLNTHGHFDHTGGNGWFSDAWMSEYAAGEAKRAFGDALEYPLDYTIHTLREGDRVDLGGRELEVLAIGAHSPGSLAYLDAANGLLFTGDELESGQVLCMGGNEAIRRHLANMEKLFARKDEISFILPAHNGSPILPEYIDLFIDFDRRILAGEEGSREVTSPTWGGFGRIDSAWRRLQSPAGTGIVYKLEK